VDESTAISLCVAAEASGDCYTAAVCCRALYGIVPVDLIRGLTAEQWRHIEHLSMRAAEKTVAGWLRAPTDEKLARAQTEQITFAKGTPHK
jgi:hypothetical protein